MVDITENRKQIAETVNTGLVGGFSDVVKSQTGYAIGGATILFFYAQYKRQPWFGYVIAGLIAGSLVGCAVEGIKKKFVDE